eukprot:411796-Pleurochrysis_carterae.AAC.1
MINQLLPKYKMRLPCRPLDHSGHEFTWRARSSAFAVLSRLTIVQSAGESRRSCCEASFKACAWLTVTSAPRGEAMALVNVASLGSGVGAKTAAAMVEAETSTAAGEAVALAVMAADNFAREIKCSTATESQSEIEARDAAD